MNTHHCGLGGTIVQVYSGQLNILGRAMDTSGVVGYRNYVINLFIHNGISFGYLSHILHDSLAK